METMAELARSQQTDTYQLVDGIYEAYVARQLVRGAAETLLDHRREHAQENQIEYAPIDALSTADKLLDAEKRFGVDSEQYNQKWQGLLLDCQRLVGEWYRKNTSEYFEPVRHVFNEREQAFFSHGLSIRQMTENALVPITEDLEEEDRRINERVEEETPHILRSLGSIALGKGIVTISQCTDSAISSYNADMNAGKKHRGYRGYVPEIEKVMIRHIVLDPGSNDRFETQIGIPGTYATHEIFQIALADKGIEAGHMDKTELHGSQILVDEDPMDFIEYLDSVMSREWARNIFMGEEVSPNFVKDYDAYKEQALARKKALVGWSTAVSLFVLDLARDGFDRSKAPGHVEDFVKNLLLNLAKNDINIAEQMFDKQTALGLQEVANLERQGRYEEAQDKWGEVERNAPGGGSCGGGSCGMEGVTEGSSEDKELRKLMGADGSDTIVKDKERSCKCGSKSIVYAYNKSKVIKYCTSCTVSEKTYKKVA